MKVVLKVVKRVSIIINDLLFAEFKYYYHRQNKLFPVYLLIHLYTPPILTPFQPLYWIKWFTFIS